MIFIHLIFKFILFTFHTAYALEIASRRNQGGPVNGELNRTSQSSQAEPTLTPSSTPPTIGDMRRRGDYDGKYPRDEMNIHDKKYMSHISEDLINDAHTHMIKVIAIAEMHKSSLGFEVGTVMGLIQQRYRHLMEMWREVQSKRNNVASNRPRTRLWPNVFVYRYQPGLFWSWWDLYIEEQSNNYYISTYTMMFELERDIRKMIEMLMVMPNLELGLNTTTVVPFTLSTMKTVPTTTTLKATTKRQAEKTEAFEYYYDSEYDEPTSVVAESVASSDGPPRAPTFGPATRRTSTTMTTEEAAEGEGGHRRRHGVWRPGGQRRVEEQNFEEERYKHRMREQYLLKKLGLNESGHTPKPRFRLGWPVEETWDDLPMY